MNIDAIVTTVKGEKIHVSDVITHMKLKGLFRSAIYELIEKKVLTLTIEEMGITVSNEEVEKKARAARTALSIVDPQNFKRYLDFYGVSAEQWYNNIRDEAICDVLKQQLVSPRKITEYYRRDPLRYASVSIARIVCRTREEADRVLVATTENKQDFVELARCFSADESTRLSGGFIGNVKRGMLPSEVEQKAFESTDNQVIGPFRENSLWTIYKVYTVNVPKLTDALKNAIRDQIFNEWLREQVCTVPA
ncbi:Parvulin-like PPIase [Azospirillaceae bacterium]